jgi:hypothetical protein
MRGRLGAEEIEENLLGEEDGPIRPGRGGGWISEAGKEGHAKTSPCLTWWMICSRPKAESLWTLSVPLSTMQKPRGR